MKSWSSSWVRLLLSLLFLLFLSPAFGFSYLAGGELGPVGQRIWGFLEVLFLAWIISPAFPLTPKMVSFVLSLLLAVLTLATGVYLFRFPVLR